MFLNSALFTAMNGYVRHPVMQIASIALPVNLSGLIISWIAFARGTRRGLGQIALGMVLLSIINYFVVCNLWTVFLHGE